VAIRSVPPKTIRALAREWDAVADMRARQESAGRDISFRHVLLPAMRELIGKIEYSRVIDVGCGTGVATKSLFGQAGHVVGIDISANSVALAGIHGSDRPNMSFVRTSVEAYARNYRGRPFQVVTANMFLMTCPDLQSAVRAVARLLKRGGHFVWTAAHPCFWPTYWGYASAPWFKYESEIFIEAPFNISLEREARLTTTHIHRPLHRYVEALSHAGLTIERVLEPMPSHRVEEMYPKPWTYPRFLAVRCVKD